MHICASSLEKSEIYYQPLPVHIQGEMDTVQILYFNREAMPDLTPLDS